MLQQLNTKRLHLRQLTEGDCAPLTPILGDDNVMYAWEGGFSDKEIREFIQMNIARYHRDGYSYLAVVLRETGETIGLCGPLKETVEGSDYVGVGYIFKKSCWGKGYAFEAARAALEYGFHELKAGEVVATIRPSNSASIGLAGKLGMKKMGEFIKHYKGKDMPHLVYKITAEEFAAQK